MKKKSNVQNKALQETFVPNSALYYRDTDSTKTFCTPKMKEHAAKCFMQNPSSTYMIPQNPLAAQKSNETRKIHMFNISESIIT
jgi:hypothetical protein